VAEHASWSRRLKLETLTKQKTRKENRPVMTERFEGLPRFGDVDYQSLGKEVLLEFAVRYYLRCWEKSAHGLSTCSFRGLSPPALRS
jgi:hypothetical protein